MTETETLEPGSQAWQQFVTASKIAVILGVAPESWGGRRKLWNLMTGRDPGEPQNEEMSRGHYLEPGILMWFADRHSDWTIATTSTVFSERLTWACARPDSIADDGDTRRYVEAKTANEPDEWGRPGTDEIPRYYVAQAQWQMHMTEGTVAETCIPVLLPFLKFEEYRVRYNRDLAMRMEAKAFHFMELVWRDTPPAIDSSVATYESMRRTHPDIDDREVEVTAELAREYLITKRTSEEATGEHNTARSKMLDAMGNARRAICDGQTVAIRQARGDGAPFVTEPRHKADHNLLPKEENAA